MVDGRREKLFCVGTKRKKMVKPGKGEKCKTQGPRGRQAGQVDKRTGRLAGWQAVGSVVFRWGVGLGWLLTC